MARRITSFRKQAAPQSCTALAIKCTLHEFGLGTYSGVAGGELTLWNELKRGSTAGEEEILPHAAIACLRSRGCTVELIQDPARVKPLKLHAPKDYSDYKSGLASKGIVPRKRPLDLDADFADDARVFMIVGFISLALRKLATHTILCRREGAEYWALNPDGATDKAYTRIEMESFLAHANPLLTGPEFASKDIYVYTGIAFRVVK